MQLAIFGQAFDRHDLRAIRLNREYSARFHRFPVHHYRTGATIGCVTPDVGAGQIELFAQELHQEQPRLHAERIDLAIDRHSDGLDRTLACLLARTGPLRFDRTFRHTGG